MTPTPADLAANALILAAYAGPDWDGGDLFWTEHEVDAGAVFKALDAGMDRHGDVGRGHAEHAALVLLRAVVYGSLSSAAVRPTAAVEPGEAL